MANAALKPCNYPKCKALLVSGAYCDQHKRQIDNNKDQRRGSSTARGYGYKWQQASKAFLKSHPLCQCDECKEGLIRLRASYVVDHKIPHCGNMSLFWDHDNWQAMSKPCHDKKTATQDGGFKGRTGGGQKSEEFFF